MQDKEIDQTICIYKHLLGVRRSKNYLRIAAHTRIDQTVDDP